jgi:hypothetical protein
MIIKIANDVVWMNECAAMTYTDDIDLCRNIPLPIRTLTCVYIYHIQYTQRKKHAALKRNHVSAIFSSFKYFIRVQNKL